MGDAMYDDAGTSWGQAEADAMDRCLQAPGFANRGTRTPDSPRLTRIIETEIIPRLLLAHLEQASQVPSSGLPGLTPADIETFARIVIDPRRDGTMDHVEYVRAFGHSLQVVFLDLLAPTARLLGDMWSEDLCSFTDVTIGLSRLQQALRELGSAFENEVRPEIRGRILLAAAPGEQHSFGLAMLETFFRHAGWEVCGGTTYTASELLRLAREEWLDAIGLSLSSDVFYDQARDLLASLRNASRNSSTVVIVGGRYFTDNPDHATAIGADTMAHDAPDALRQADAQLKVRLARC